LKQVVIDASVVLKWYLPDEEHGRKALHLLDKYISNEIDFVAPSLLEYEVINGLIIAQRRGRVKEEKLLTAIDGFLNLDIKLKNISNIYTRVLHYCEIYSCSVYDASYLAVAEKEGISMITADERLYNMVKKDLKWARWIEDI
jgi:predicted nucleic acid-binding protein